ncbi:MAG: molybdopterin-dependent oxidoreductase [Candidatus Heimdallarchaeota archaeon]|nr:molybdopterin-dependent oxidoreductase [Candidatus Heimdallarchaeota archaeon]MCK4770035.1 molybdopterin-dependent oxidoreductase [Candidatus Heimdallarchaeota archaeon]
MNDLIPPHTRGESVFVDDIPEPNNMLQVAVFVSDIPHGKIKSLDISKAEKGKGVIRVITAKDIPGENQLGRIIQDEELLAKEKVDFIGQPIAVIYAETKEQANKARNLITIEYEELQAIFDPREAAKKGSLIAPSRTFTLGDVDSIWDSCETIVEGRADSGGQEHVYMETQGSLAIPREEGRVLLYSSTQNPSTVQSTVASILGFDMNKIEVDVTRLGGGFGGKEDQATAWAAFCALGVFYTGRPVKLVLDRNEDITITGKRHPYSTDYKLGLNEEGKILAFSADCYQNSGAAADLSTAVLGRTLFHLTNAYFIPNVQVTAYPCRTNLVPYTAFRGFGAPQGMYVIECALSHAADESGIPISVLQKKNLLVDGDQFPYGMHVENAHAKRSFSKVVEDSEYEKLMTEKEEFNAKSKFMKKGISVMPICFGISFTSIFMNQAGALVNVYYDGSVNVSTGSVEMGQGVNMKIKTIAARSLSIDPKRIRVESTNTSRVINTSPSSASSGADLNGKATEFACLKIIERLKDLVREKLGKGTVSLEDETVYLDGVKTELVWEKLIWLAYTNRVNLAAQALYATPGIHFDNEKEKGKPFAYHVFGSAVTEVSVDCLRGTYTIDKVHVVHDAGRSLNYLIDLGQVEGGLVQGIGWMTLEELQYIDGKLISDALATYKVPDVHFAPEIKTTFLEDTENPHAVLQSKGIGEPPFMYGIGAYFALKDAAQAFRADKEWEYIAPLTPERLLLFLHDLE